METIWKDIKSLEGYYQVSNTGEARSLDRLVRNGRGKGFHIKKGSVLNLGKTGDGYPMFIACVKQKTKPILIHRAMMEAFEVPNPLNLPCINHRDENKANNFLFINPDGSVNLEKSNLEWCDYEYNVNYGTSGKRIEEISKKVLQYTKEGVLVKEFPSIRKAQLSLGGKGDVKYALNKSKNNYSHGYIWKYKE